MGYQKLWRKYSATRAWADQWVWIWGPYSDFIRFRSRRVNSMDWGCQSWAHREGEWLNMGRRQHGWWQWIIWGWAFRGGRRRYCSKRACKLGAWNTCMSIWSVDSQLITHNTENRDKHYLIYIYCHIWIPHLISPNLGLTNCLYVW